MCNLLSECGKELSHSSDGHGRSQPRLDAPDPALVVEVAGQRGQGGRGSAIGHHGEGTRHGGVLQVENEGGSIVRRQLLIPRRGQMCGMMMWKKSIFFLFRVRAVWIHNPLVGPRTVFQVAECGWPSTGSCSDSSS